MKRNYELTVVLSAQLSSTDLTKLEKSIESLLTKVGGKVDNKEDWGSRKFTYEIQKQTEGYYRHLIVELPSDAVEKLRRELMLLQGLMRYLIVVQEKPNKKQETPKENKFPSGQAGIKKQEVKSIEQRARGKRLIAKGKN